MAGLSYSEVTSYYAADSWAIDDLIRLLERIADEAGVSDSQIASATVPATPKGDSVASGTSAHSAPAFQDDEPAQFSPLESESTENIETRSEVLAEDSGPEPVTCANDPSLRAHFESLRQVLQSHGFHPCLNEELREFLEPEDTIPPTKFLGNSVREVLEIPFERLAGSWVGGDRVDCLMRMLDRAVRSVQSSEAEQEEGCETDGTALRPRTNPAPRELHVDAKSWRAWTDAIHAARLQRLKLGTVAECLRDLFSDHWDQPLSQFTTLPLSALAMVPGVGPKRVESVIWAVRNLGAELLSINFEPSICMKFIPGPLRGAQEWIERVLEARLVPDLAELVVQLVRPLAWQLRHDLPDRESQIAVHRLQLDESPKRSTLEELAAVYGITRERIRQLEQWGPRVLRTRFPQGRYLLDTLYRQLSTTPGAEPQARLVYRIAKLCFESDVAPLLTSNEVSTAWEEAARLKLTPMTSDQIMDWSRSRLPLLAPDAVLDSVRSQSLSLQIDGRPVQWFSRTEIDRILYTLSQQRTPVRLEELVLFDRVQNDPGLSGSHLTRDLSADDERSLWGRIRRDPRFVVRDHHLLMPADGCGFERVDGKWMIRLVPEEKSNAEGERKLSVAALAQLIVDGLSHRGIADATSWGVHRFANEIVREHFHLCFADSVTPHVLADMLVKTSDGLIRSMRRRRLRWDHESLGLPARGKRGWVGHIVTECGHPMLLSELACRLRDQYQDYADYVVNQLTLIADEDGEIDNRAQFLTGFGQRIPNVVLPTNWKGDSSIDSVSTGVANVIRRLAKQIRSKRLELDELNAVGWLKSLVAEQLSANVNLSDDEEDESENDSRERDISDQRHSCWQFSDASKKSDPCLHHG
ncbi:MAG: sigma factor-like helix-turn-helix DNA-binding protein [Planctomycetaceae bacterium]